MKDNLTCPKCGVGFKWISSTEIFFKCNSFIAKESDSFFQSKVCEKDAELTKLKADVVRLRAALKPFARFTEVSETWPHRKAWPDDAEIVGKIWEKGSGSVTVNITCGHLRSTARALEETKP